MIDEDWLARKKRLLVKYGFIKNKYRGLFAGKTLKEMEKLVAKMSDAEVDKYADVEKAEIAKGQIVETGYPNSLVRNHLVYETTNDPIEETYFFEKDMIRVDFHYTNFYKIIDVFAATEQSSFWGVSEQRLGLQQDKVSQYLRGISEMIKALFQIVRELRIIDERLSYYYDIENNTPTSLSSEITLKGVWIDQVEGGAKNPASVYGLANTVGFSILPDLFFRTQVKDLSKLDEQIDKMQFNEKVKEVLKRKLRQFYEWKKRTFAELKQRRRFTLKYLRQHYDTINLYISWIRPYLMNIERLQMDRRKMDSADMVSSFEGAMSEVEFLATKDMGEVHSCLLLNFVFRTRPSMVYHGEGYQRGPQHVGRVEMTIRGYAWDKQEIRNYIKMMEEENMQMLATIDKSLEEALNALGDELFKYLEEAGEKMGGEEEQPPPKKKGFKLSEVKKSVRGYVEPFTSVWAGFRELAQAFGFSQLFSLGGGKGKPASKALAKTFKRKDAAGDAKLWAWMAYKNYKKAHKMITW
ncbi:hypothetical protein DRJ48_01120 [Candidatus Woesearchaeota archaeon]|nr:MAG: hypothetical protein DRJ48_01120 [Candidatus Woesearchaeota archaeon]